MKTGKWIKKSLAIAAALSLAVTGSNSLFVPVYATEQTADINNDFKEDAADEPAADNNSVDSAGAEDNTVAEENELVENEAEPDMEAEDAAEEAESDATAAKDKAVENKAEEDKAAENKAEEDKAAENKAEEDKAVENETEDKAAENETEDNEAAENIKSEEKTTEDESSEDEAAQEKETQEDAAEEEAGMSEEEAGMSEEEAPAFLAVSKDAGSITAVITAKVTLDDSAPGDEKFTFILRDAGGMEIGRAQNDSEGVITFEPIAYTEAGTYDYTIEEVNDGRSDIVYDTTVVTASVSVGDPNSEIAGATVTGNYHDYLDNQDYYYMQDKMTGQEYMVFCLDENRHMPYGNDYRTIQDVDDATIANALTTADTERAGKIKRLLYYFTLYPDAYKPFDQQKMIWEVSGTDKGMATQINSILAEITDVPSNFHTLYFDSGDSTYQALLGGYIVPDPVVTLTAGGNGEQGVFANATASPAADPAGDSNEKSVSVVIKAVKTLDGAAPGDKRFTFELYDWNGDKVGTAQNDSEGNIVFDPQVFTEPGIYTYKIVEVNDGQSGISYDTKEITAKITVTEVTSELDGLELTGLTASQTQYYNGRIHNLVDHYYMQDADGNQYTVFCLNGDKQSPTGQTFSAEQDEDDDVLQEALSTPSAENLEKVKKCLYYFLLHPSQYTAAQQQRIIWSASGWASSGSSTYTTIVNTICSQITSMPDNFHTVYFDCGNEKYQKLIYGYLAEKPTVTLNAEGSTEQAVFENTTKPSGLKFPETGGSGTLPLYVVGTAVIAGAFLYLFRKNKAKA